MEEERFSAKWLPDKKDYHDFGRIHIKKSKVSVLYLVLAIVFFVLNIALTIAGIDLGSIVLTVAYLMFFYWLFFGEFIGRNAYKSITKQSKGLEQTMYFGDTSFSLYTELSSGNTNYKALESVCENDNIFALYVSKAAAHVLPKRAFVEGTPEAFRSFIEGKTGQPVKRFRTVDRLGGRIAAAILGFVVMVVGLVGAMLVHDAISEREKTFTEGDYSITLTGQFSKDMEAAGESGDYCDFFSDDVGVCVFREEDRDVIEYFEHQPTLEEYANDWLEYWGVAHAAMTSGEDGSLRVKYDFTDDAGETYYYYDVIRHENGCYWMTEFCCFKEDQTRYAEKFVTWGDSIEIR